MTKFFRIDGEYTIHDVKAFQMFAGQPVISTVRLAEIAGLDVDNVNRGVINAYESAVKRNPSLKSEVMNEVFYHDQPGVKYLKKAMVLGWGPFTTYVRTFGMRPQEVLKNAWNTFHEDFYNGVRKKDGATPEKCEDVESVEIVEATVIEDEEEKRVITLKQIVDIINKEERENGEVDSKNQPKTRHAEAMKKIEKLSEEPSFGRPLKIRVRVETGVSVKEIETYHFTKKQAIAAAAKINNKYLMRVVDELERATKELAQLRGNTQTLQLPDFTNPAIAAREFGKLSIKYADALEEKDAALSEVAIATSLAKEVGESSVREFVKELAIERFGLKTCFTWLREREYIMKNGEPYQKWVNKGYFTLKPWKEDKGEVAHFQPMLTELGRRKIADIIRKDFGELNTKGGVA